MNFAIYFDSLGLIMKSSTVTYHVFLLCRGNTLIFIILFLKIREILGTEFFMDK